MAAVTAALLLLVGWLAARHEAEVAHVRDQRGEVIHAEELADHHEVSPSTHLHGREDHGHLDGACELIGLAHASLIAAQPPTEVALVAVAEELGAPPVIAHGSSVARYRIAPKTSPPARI